jgi:hypothetical protein
MNRPQPKRERQSQQSCKQYGEGRGEYPENQELAPPGVLAIFLKPNPPKQHHDEAALEENVFAHTHHQGIERFRPVSEGIQEVKDP